MRITSQLSDNEISLVVQDYSSGLKLIDISQKYNISKPIIRRIIKKSNIPTRKNRKYTCDFNFFETIDTKEKAYWLGFLFADGYVHKNYVGINLARKDKDHLNRFLQSINATYEVRDDLNVIGNKHYERSSIKIYSEKMVSDLIKHGCIPRKTNKIKWPTINTNINHFMRGYFDGDGCINLRKGNSQPTFLIYSNYGFCDSYAATIHENCDVNYTTLCPHKNYATLRYIGRNKVEKIFNFIYENATIFLPRKFQKFAIKEKQFRNPNLLRSS